MAALYLHNAIFIPEASQDVPSHTRTRSSGTFRTVASDIHPTDPLLSSPDYHSLAFQDLLTRQPTHPDGPDATWDMRLSFQGVPPTKEEQRELQRQQVRRRLRLLKACILALQTVIAIWTAYNVIKYFIAIHVYSSSSGQAFAVSLGTSSLISLVYLVCANVLYISRAWLVRQDVPLRYIRITETLFRWLASFFFLSPAIVNFVLVFVFKTHSEAQLQILSRCDLDVDVIWSVTRQPCSDPDPQMTWAAWAGLSTVRLVLSFILTILLHSALYSHKVLLRHPDSEPFTEAPRTRRRRRRFRNTHTSSSSLAHLTSPPLSLVSRSSYGLHPPGSLPGSMRSNVRPPSTSPHPPVRQQSPPPSTSVSRHNSTPPPASGDDLHDLQEGDMNRSSPLPQARRSSSSPEPPADVGSHARTATPNPPSDREVHRFVDQFRSLVTQVSQKVEDSLDIREPDDVFNPYDTADTSSSSSSRLPSILAGADEFGRPYGADEQIRILNGYVRKMPTIESIGSRELGSIRSGRSTEWEKERVASIHSLSRPPTQLTMRTGTTTDYGCVINGGYGSPTPSRSNSLNWMGTPSSPVHDITGQGSDPPWLSSASTGSGSRDLPPLSPLPVAHLRQDGSSVHSYPPSPSVLTQETDDASMSTRATKPEVPTVLNHPYRTASPV